MAHYAKVNSDNIVEAVVVISDADEESGRGLDICKQIDSDENIKWIQGSYNARIRNKMPGAGDVYDEDKDIFISPKPHPSWILDESTNLWNAPIPHPETGSRPCLWDEDLHQSDKTKGWVEV